jgi:hypothetical protein
MHTGGDLAPPEILPRGGRFPPGPVVVEIVAPQRSSVIYATTSGSEPSPAQHELKGHSPLVVTITRACTLKAMLSNGLLGSETVAADFVFDPAGLPRTAAAAHPPPPAIVVRPRRDTTDEFMSPRDLGKAARPHTIGGRPVSGARLAGVGVVLKRDQDGVRVKEVAAGSAAALDGRIEVRDRLLSIDGRSVEGKSMSVLGDEIRGVEGTYISMTFSRAGARAGMPPHEFEVSLCRTMPLVPAGGR